MLLDTFYSTLVTYFQTRYIFKLYFFEEGNLLPIDIQQKKFDHEGTKVFEDSPCKNVRKSLIADHQIRCLSYVI